MNLVKRTDAVKQTFSALFVKLSWTTHLHYIWPSSECVDIYALNNTLFQFIYLPLLPPFFEPLLLWDCDDHSGTDWKAGKMQLQKTKVLKTA